jgi:hypothetical protein
VEDPAKTLCMQLCEHILTRVERTDIVPGSLQDFLNKTEEM